MKRLKIVQLWAIMAIMGLISPLAAAALNAHYCAHSASYIQLGDTTAQVAAACGQPVQVHTQAAQTANNQPIEIWSYTASQLVSLDNPPITQFTNTTRPIGSHPLKLEMVSGKIARITYNNIALNAISVCPRRTSITVGESEQQVLQKCGKPSHTTLLKQVSASTQPANNITTWHYDDGYGADFTLTFSGDRLTQIGI